jgi:chromosomal replication initiation ATPase DnaA
MTTKRKDRHMTTMIDEALSDAGRRIDELEARMHVHAAERRHRMRRHINALRQEEANAIAAGRRAPDQLDDRAARLRSRIEVADRSFDADLAEDRRGFAAAVEAELRGWEMFTERLQAAAAARRGRAREQAEAGITQLQRQSLAVTRRLDDLAAERWDRWQERRKRVTAARDELERMADDLSASLF